MANTKHEDAIMEMGFGYFRDTILRLLGIEYEFAEIGPTELVELTIHSMYIRRNWTVGCIPTVYIPYI